MSVPPNTPPTAPPNVQWSCEVSGATEPPLTVGTPFAISCKGPSVGALDAKTLSFVLPKPDQFRLKILNVQNASPESVDLTVTSYGVGQNDMKNVLLTDGQNSIALNGIQFEVQSILDPGNPEPKPFPPEGPVGMYWPLWAILAIAAVGFAAVTIVFGVRNRRRRRRDFSQWLTDNVTPLSAYDQFNKELRQAGRERDPKKQLAEIERSTRWYLARRLASPLLDASLKKIVSALAEHDRTKKRTIEQLTRQLFGEFSRLETIVQSHANARDEALNHTLPALQDLAREFGDAVEKLLARSRGGR